MMTDKSAARTLRLIDEWLRLRAMPDQRDARALEAYLLGFAVPGSLRMVAGNALRRGCDPLEAVEGAWDEAVAAE